MDLVNRTALIATLDAIDADPSVQAMVLVIPVKVTAMVDSGLSSETIEDRVHSAIIAELMDMLGEV